MKHTIIYLFLFLVACQKSEPIINPSEPTDSTDQIIEVLWRSPIDEGRDLNSSHYIEIFKDKVIVGGDWVESGRIHVFNKNNGSKLKEYIFPGKVNADFNQSLVYKHLFIAYCLDGIIAINMNTYDIAWEIDFKSLGFMFDYPMLLKDDFIFFKVKIKDPFTKHYHSIIYKMNPLNGYYKEIVNLKATNDYSQIPNIPLFWEDNNGEEHIIYTIEKDDLGDPLEQYQDLVCVRTSDQSILWEHRNMSKPSSSRFHEPLRYGNTVIISSDWSIYGYDIYTGDSLWRVEFENYKPFASWYQTMHLLKDNRLYVNSTGEGIGCIDVDKGKLLWFNPEGSSTCSERMIYVDDMLLYGSFGRGRVYVVDAFTGKYIYNGMPIGGKLFYKNVAYDDETNTFFTHTPKEIVAFKIHRD